MRKIIGFVAVAMITLCAWSLPASAQSAPKKYLSAATTNAMLVRGGPSQLTTALVANTTSTAYYIKLFNKAAAPVCGTDVPVWTIAAPAGATVAPPLGNGLLFPSGIGFCITANLADNDSTAAAPGVIVNLGVSGR